MNREVVDDADFHKEPMIPTNLKFEITNGDVYMNTHTYVLNLRDKLYRFLNIASEALFCRLTADDE